MWDDVGCAVLLQESKLTFFLEKLVLILGKPGFFFHSYVFEFYQYS